MIEFLLAVAAVYSVYRLGRAIWQHCQAAAQTRQTRRHEAAQRQMQSDKQQQERRRAAAKINAAACLMQVALLQVDQSPDFRRAATFAKQAKNVPVSFRIRQFQRFRPLIVRHLATRLRGGVAAEDLMDGLTELVTALGLADYEADYIRREAEPHIRPQAEVRPGYAQQARQQQLEHDQRVESIRNLPGIAAELREQLMEQEEQRFRERLLALGNADGEQANP